MSLGLNRAIHLAQEQLTDYNQLFAIEKSQKTVINSFAWFGACQRSDLLSQALPTGRSYVFFLCNAPGSVLYCLTAENEEYFIPQGVLCSIILNASIKMVELRQFSGNNLINGTLLNADYPWALVSSPYFKVRCEFAPLIRVNDKNQCLNFYRRDELDSAGARTKVVDPNANHFSMPQVISK